MTYRAQRTANEITGTFYRVPVYSNSTATTLAGYIFFRNEPRKIDDNFGTITGSMYVFPAIIFTKSGYFSSTDTFDPTAELQSFTIEKPINSSYSGSINSVLICNCGQYFVKATFHTYGVSTSGSSFLYDYELTLDYTTVTYPDYTYKVPYVSTLVDTSTTLQVACSNPSATVTNNYGTQKVGKPIGIEVEELECTGVTPRLDWTASTLPSSTSWQSVTYGGGKFVAISASGAVAYSTDGISWSWTESYLPSSNNWRSVTYGDGKFVAVASGSMGSDEAAYSTDGITWTESTLPEDVEWWSVTYGNGKFVAVADDFNVGGSNAVAYSIDGITWTAKTLPSSANWRSVTYGDGKFVAVAIGTNKAAYSTDGITWRTSTLPFSANWVSVTYGNGKFVVVDYGTTSTASNKVAYSTNGTSWTAKTLPYSDNWRSVAYGDGKFVAVASIGSYESAYSTDGITWRESILPSNPDWQSVTCGNGKFVAVASGSNKVAYSPSQIATYKDTTTQQPKSLPTGVSIGNIQVGNTVTNTYTTTGNYSYIYKAIRS